MKEFKDITINGDVVRFLHIRKGEENKASVVIERKEAKRNEEERTMDTKTKERRTKQTTKHS